MHLRATSLLLAAALALRASAAVAQAPAAPVLLSNEAPAPMPTSFQDALRLGWPGPGNTGHPASLQLTSTAGRTVSADNTVIDGQKITGGLTIAARNVTVRNSWIISSFGTGESVNGTGVIKIAPGASATIEHCTLDGSNRTHTAVWYEGTTMTLRGNNMFGVNDGIFVWDADNFTIEDNYLHDFTEATANGHVDGFQTEGASHGVIRHNTIDVQQGQTSAVAIWNSRRNSDDILVDDNLLTGGGFTVYAEDYSPSEASPAGGYAVTRVRFTNNKFSTVHYPCVGDFGVWYTRGAPSDGWSRSGNAVIETQQNLDTRNPVVNGSECR
jgi:parallel beta-helix repeat protein